MKLSLWSQMFHQTWNQLLWWTKIRVVLTEKHNQSKMNDGRWIMGRPLIGRSIEQAEEKQAPRPRVRQKLLVVMLDGCRWDYVEREDKKTLPGFAMLHKEGVRAEYVRPVFPAVSYTNWASLSTGDSLVLSPFFRSFSLFSPSFFLVSVGFFPLCFILQLWVSLSNVDSLVLSLFVQIFTLFSVLLVYSIFSVVSVIFFRFVF